jgi:2-polyprenyl-6-methoxyphenol hydroxylase-like FAD-dependent oxidoreductase
MFSGSTLVLGGGPAGLTAAHMLAKQGRPVTLLERDACSAASGTSSRLGATGCIGITTRIIRC